MAVWVECKKQLENHFGRQLDSVFGPAHKMCDATATACKADPCKNGGACSAAIPDDHDGGHRRLLQSASSFVCVCKAPWGGRTCTTCATEGYDPKTQCKTCLGAGYNPRQQCKICKDPLFDPAQQCKACKNSHFAEQGNCRTCKDSTFEPMKGCLACKNPLYDPQAQCKSCFVKGADPQHQCKACRSARYDFETQCRTCKDPAYDPTKSCATKLRFYVKAGATEFVQRAAHLNAGDVVPLADLITKHPGLTTIELSGNNFGDKSPLPTTGLPHAKKVDLSACHLTDKAVPALAQSLSRSPQLAAVDLRGNKFSAAGCAKLRAAAPVTAVRAHNGFRCDKVDDFRYAVSADGHTLDLRYKSLGATDSTTVATIITTHPQLTAIDLRDNNFGDKSPLPTTGVPHAKEVDLSLCHLTDKAVPALAQSVSRSPQLATVDLIGNDFGDKSPLPTTGLPRAKKVDLYSCYLTDKAVPALAQSLSRSPQLATVGLRGNKFSAAGCAKLRAAAPSTAVQAHNGFRCDEVDDLRYAVSADGHTLDLQGKYLGATIDYDSLRRLPQMITTVATIITTHPGLTTIDLRYNMFSAAGCAKLRAAAPATVVRAHNGFRCDKVDDLRYAVSADGHTLDLGSDTLDPRYKSLGATDSTTVATIITTHPQLTAIDLRDNNFGDKSPLPTTGVPHAKEVDLSLCHLTDKAVPALAQSLSRSPQLDTVDLRDNNFGDKSPLPTTGLPRATYLRLPSSDLTDKAVPALAQSLSRSPQLATIDLSFNKFSAAGCAKLRAAVPIFVKLQCDAHDPKLTDAQVPAIVAALRTHPHISSVDLRYNKLSASGCARARAVVAAALLSAYMGFRCDKVDVLRNAWTRAEHGFEDYHGWKIPPGWFVLEGGGDIDIDAPALASGIRRHPGLAFVYITDAKFQMASPLPTEGLPQVAYLRLKSCHLTDKVVPALVSTLARSPQLATVDLRGNKFSAAGCAKLQAAVPVYVRVVCDNSDQPKPTDKDAPAIAAALAKHPQLTTVWLNGEFKHVSPLPASGLPHATAVILLQSKLTDKAVPALVEFLKHSPRLGAADNAVAAVQFSDFVKTGKRVAVVIRGEFSEAGCARLKAALPDTHNLGYAFSDTCRNLKY
eukprot:COSAG05_NODE_107_length_18696_cov_209.227766_13_plen_1124_part_00